MASCQSSCKANCAEVETIRDSFCDGLCVNHCMNYKNYLTSAQVKCLLTCNYLQYAESVCNPLCKIGFNQSPSKSKVLKAGEEETGYNSTEVVKKQDMSNVCTGYGKELCYKLCRLHHFESIETCLCACCKCKF